MGNKPIDKAAYSSSPIKERAESPSNRRSSPRKLGLYLTFSLLDISYFLRSPPKYAQKGSITDWASQLRQRIPQISIKDKESPLKLDK